MLSKLEGNAALLIALTRMLQSREREFEENYALYRNIAPRVRGGVDYLEAAKDRKLSVDEVEEMLVSLLF